jgi:hypothetical protein
MEKLLMEFRNPFNNNQIETQKLIKDLKKSVPEKN